MQIFRIVVGAFLLGIGVMYVIAWALGKDCATEAMLFATAGNMYLLEAKVTELERGR